MLLYSAFNYDSIPTVDTYLSNQIVREKIGAGFGPSRTCPDFSLSSELTSPVHPHWVSSLQPGVFPPGHILLARLRLTLHPRQDSLQLPVLSHFCTQKAPTKGCFLILIGLQNGSAVFTLSSHLLSENRSFWIRPIPVAGFKVTTQDRLKLELLII